MSAFKDWNEAHYNGHCAREAADFIWKEADGHADANADATGAQPSGKCNAESAGHAQGGHRTDGDAGPGGGNFFANVNAAALGKLDAWVPALHPMARKNATGAWRITSKDLSRQRHQDIKEDLYYYPDGGRGHGDEDLTPVDSVLRYGTAANATAAAMWLCLRLGVEPTEMGWKAEGNERAPKDAPAGSHRSLDYRMTEDGIEWRRHTRQGPVWTPLTNFTARIVSDIAQDDGVDVTRALEIEAGINGRTHRITIQAVQFSQMTWPLEHLGAEAAVQPGQGSKDRTRSAIQILSGTIPQRCVYTHTGWRHVGEQWVYMHGGGALGPVGPVVGLEVQLPEQLERYTLPSGGHGLCDQGLTDAVKTSLAMRKVAPGGVIIPLLGAVYRAPLGGADFSVHISGQTGAQKSELAALAQQHYGAAMDSRSCVTGVVTQSLATSAAAAGATGPSIAPDKKVVIGRNTTRP